MEINENANVPPDLKKSKASSITMPGFYWEKVYGHCKETGLTVSDVIRRALEVYFKQKKI